MEELEQPQIKLSNAQKTKLIDILGKEMVDELIQTVGKIEASPPTTKNHYGAYMQILGRFGKNKIIVGNLLILMGANRQGIEDALKVI